MKQSFVFFLIFAWSDFFGQSPVWLTEYEKSGFMKTPRYQATIDFIKKLDTLSPIIHYESFGQSPQGRELPLVIIDRDGYSTIEDIKNSRKIVLMVQCGIHSGESEGKDAMLLLARDMAVEGKYLDLLENASILWIPIFNVDGHERFGPYSRINQNGPEEMGWRTTAQNLNLNRDFMKADSPEMQAWLKMFNTWMPDFFIDSHTTDGADYQYVLTFGIEIFGNLDPGLTQWQKQNWTPFITQQMENAGFPVFPYISFRNWHDPRSGLISGVATPRFSTGYAAAQNRPAVLIETHMLKPYQIRVESTLELIRLTMELLNRENKLFLQLIKEADERVESPVFIDNPFPLSYQIDWEDSIPIDFKGVEYEIVNSDLTGGDWFQYSDIPVTFQLNYFNKNDVSKAVNLPMAYIIPPQWNKVIDILKLHGVQFSILKEPATLSVNAYHFTYYDWQKQSYEGRHPMTKIEFSEQTDSVTFPAGSVVVKTAQRTARIIAHLLEPAGPDSFVHWGFFDAIFEQKEYAESYVMEPLARQMIKDNPTLKNSFEEWKKANPNLAKDQEEQLNWFFEQTPYWDYQKDVYPVGRILDEKELRKLIFISE